jgi:hypothetical protein
VDTGGFRRALLEKEAAMMNFSYTDEKGRRWDVEFGFDAAAGEEDSDLHCRINGQAVGMGALDRFLEALPDEALDLMTHAGLGDFPGYPGRISAN